MFKYVAPFHQLLVDGRQGMKKSDKVKGSTLDQRCRTSPPRNQMYFRRWPMQKVSWKT